MTNSTIFNFNSIKTRVTLFTLGIIVIGTWILSLSISQQLHENMQKQLADQQSSIAAILATQVDEELRERLSVLDKIGETIAPISTIDNKLLQATLEEQLVIQRLFNAGAFVVGADGVAIASIPTSVKRAGVNYIEREYIAAALKDGKSSISRPVMGKVLGTPLFNMVVPIQDAQGTIVAALVGVTDLGKPNFLDKVFQNKYSKTGYFLLEDAKYRLIITGTDKRRIMEALPPPGVNNLIDRHVDGFDDTDVTVSPLGVKVLASAKRIQIADWFIVVALPVQEAFAPVDDMKKRIMLLASFMTLVAAGLIWWMLKRELVPMFRALKQLTTLSREGISHQVLPTTGINNEISELLSGFNTLLDVLRKRESQLRALLHTIPDLIWLKDTNGTFMSCNSAFERFYGAKEADIVGKTDYDFVDKQQADSFRENDRKAMMANKALSNEEWFTFADGGYRGLFETVKAPLTDGNGQVIGVLGISRDITQRKAIELRLRMLSTAIEQSPTSVAITNVAAQIEYINSAFTKEAGYTLDEVLGQNPRVLQSGMTDAKVYDDMWAKLTNGESWQGEFVNKRKNGEIFYEEAYISPIQDDSGNVSHYVAVKLDVTTRKEAERSLRESNKKMESLLQSLAEGAYGVDTYGNCTFVNNSFLRILGYASEDEIVGKHIHELIHHSHADGSHYPASECRIYAAYKNNAENHCADEVFWHKSGYAIQVEYWSQPIVVDGVVIGAIATFFDITERKKMEQQIRHLALHDVLTNLPNRRLLIERISQAQLSSKRTLQYGALMFMDMDNFKPLNDAHGHEAGDKLLIEVADRLQKCVREVDTVARIGGDEFVVMLAELDTDETLSRQQAEKISEKIRSALAEPYFINVTNDDGDNTVVEHYCTASIGVVLFKGTVSSKEEVIKQADDAMYQAKNAGRNKIVFYAETGTD
jgi:diguanylate cyclase (GGDEF)-like protein/PAS domain S-box-containing protein